MHGYYYKITRREKYIFLSKKYIVDRNVLQNKKYVERSWNILREVLQKDELKNTTAAKSVNRLNIYMNK